MEALRGFAAFYVLLHHISSSYLGLKHTVWGLPFRFGQEGVLIFFLLSGFVICYSYGGGPAGGHDFGAYLMKRGRRIYPIFILSLFLAYAIQCLAAGQFVPVGMTSLFGNLFMLQDHPEKPGVFLLPFADNMPLWSLSYEWWFYMMFFPINRWVPQSKQKFLVLALCLVGLLVNQFLPNSLCWFLVFFIIWWAGVELAREFLATGDVTLARQSNMLLVLAPPLFWYGWLTLRWKLTGQQISFMAHPFVEFRYFFMTLVFLLLIFAWKHWGFFGFDQTLGKFGWMGSISYALYLFHYPLICDLRLFQSAAVFYFDLALRILLAFFLAWLVEGKLQKWINARTDPWLAARKKSRAKNLPGARAAESPLR